MEKLKLVVGQLSVNCYILKDEGRAVVVDPGAESERILAALDGCALIRIWLTHGHFDHTGAVAALKNATGAKVVISKEDAPLLTDSKKSLHDLFMPGGEFSSCAADEYFADTAEFAGTEFQVIPTPGHTDGCVCLLGDGMLISGDTLFAGSIGRTDFGDPEAMGASLEKLKNIEPDTLVLPGHGEVTTIGHEAEHNPYLR